jgi:hypothetical protein
MGMLNECYELVLRTRVTNSCYELVLRQDRVPIPIGGVLLMCC